MRGSARCDLDTILMTETWLTDGPTAFKHMDGHGQTCMQTRALKHARVTNKRGKIHDYWQLSPSIKVFFIRSEGVFIREMRQGHIWVKASITAFISPLQQRKKGEEEKTERRPKGYFFCLITATHSHTREVPLGDIYRACSMINGCISGRYAGSIA